VIANEILAEPDVFVRKIIGNDGRGPLMTAGFLKIFAIVRAVDRDLALSAAADRADLAVHARTVPARALFFAEFTRGIHRRISLSYHRKMPRTHVYIKVELDLSEQEKPDRVATEICRQIRKVYGVRSAEVSSIVEKD
jgi:hypothetical protein